MSALQFGGRHYEGLSLRLVEPVHTSENVPARRRTKNLLCANCLDGCERW